MIYRQGDVLVSAVPARDRRGKDVRDRGRVILAYGEVTGHAHEVIAGTFAERDQQNRPFVVDDAALPAAQLFEEPDGARYLFVDRACVLTHQEHGAIALDPGCYRITRQREYTPEEIRNVAD